MVMMNESTLKTICELSLISSVFESSKALLLRMKMVIRYTKKTPCNMEYISMKALADWDYRVYIWKFMNVK